MNTKANNVSIEIAAKRTGIPTKLIRRAVANGLALPVDATQPDTFLQEEVNLWLDWRKVGAIIEQRLRRNEHGEYEGHFIEPGEYKSVNRFILPFRGCWLVSDGGKALSSEGRPLSYHHYMMPCVRWDWDLSVIHPDDYRKCRAAMSREEIIKLRFRKGQEAGVPDYEFSSPGSKQSYRKYLNPAASDHTSHYCYKVEIIVPADGVVIGLNGRNVDPTFDGMIKEAEAANDDRQTVIMIDHGSNEFSEIAHVLARTIMVRPGQRVTQGQYLCQAGGKCFMPHLHFGVWNSWNMLFAQSLPILISECLVYENGSFKRRENVWLELGMLVKNAESHQQHNWNS